MVNKEQALSLIHSYVDSWLKQDQALFSSLLDNHFVVKEYNGKVIEGREQAIVWFSQWHEEGGQVKEWYILDWIFDPATQKGAFEWEFSCLLQSSEGIKGHRFLGISFFCLEKGLFSKINEYFREINQEYPYT